MIDSPDFTKREDNELERVLAEVAALVDDPPFFEDVEKIEAPLIKALNAFMNGGPLEEYRKLERATVVPGNVRIPNFEILYTIIHAIEKDDDSTRELVEHERDHYREAERLGIPAIILLRFFKQSDGRKSFRAAIDIHIPEHVDDEEAFREKLRTIIEAPDELSDTDQESIRRQDP